MTRVLLLGLALAVAATADRSPPRPAAVGDPIAAWVLHFDPRLGDDTVPTYRDLLAHIPERTPVVVAVADERDADTFRALVDPGRGVPVSFLYAGVHVSAWARDRYICFRKGDTPCILLPDARLVQEGTQGDLLVARGLREWAPGLRVIRSRLDLEGGNVLVTRSRVLVGCSAVADNADWCGGRVEEFAERLGDVFGRPVVVVGEDEDALPHDHIDMFVSAAGRGRLLVGDPRRAGAGAEHERWAPVYDAVAAQLRSEGFHVFRIPILHAPTGLVTWNNAVTERRGETDIVYLPRYGRPALDAAAAACWRRLGFAVRPIDVRGAIRHGGAVRCLSNELRGVALD